MYKRQEYDEYLAIPDIDGNVFVNFANGEKPGKYATEILPTGELVEYLIASELYYNVLSQELFFL